jgi:putative component of toxin-antitoxin plasmid stabilization module
MDSLLSVVALGHRVSTRNGTHGCTGSQVEEVAHLMIALVRSSHRCDTADVAELELHNEVVEWIDSLDDSEWDRTVVVIDRLVALGSSARMPLSRSLGEGLFELRFTLGPTARRITYRFTKDGRIILLTTFRKQRNNERTEIDRARTAADDCAKRYP